MCTGFGDLIRELGCVTFQILSVNQDRLGLSVDQSRGHAPAVFIRNINLQMDRVLYS